jgi:hypothetical protein
MPSPQKSFEKLQKSQENDENRGRNDENPQNQLKQHRTTHESQQHNQAIPTEKL